MGTKTGFIAGTIFALVVGTGTAYAATGGNFILGKKNVAESRTTLVNKNGAALSLNSRFGTPPLRVNNGVKVPRLNADRLDGKHASAFALAAGGTGTVDAVGEWDTEQPDMIFAVAECPRGSRLTGGGFIDTTVSGAVLASTPLGSGLWGVAVTADRAQDTADSVGAFAVCYNPRGAVRGAAAPARRSAGGDPRASFISQMRSAR
jgi:hypothetical protein